MTAILGFTDLLYDGGMDAGRSKDALQTIKRLYNAAKAGHTGSLDPIATGAIEDLMHSLKGRFTIVIVTHNMQQAARVADRTAFFSLETGGEKPVGTLIEFDDTERIFGAPRDPRTRDYVTGRFG